MKTAALVVLAIVAVARSVEVSAAGTQKIILDIHATPEGAQVLTGEEGALMGVTPLPLSYEVPGDCGQTQAVRVRWASGAEAHVAGVRLCTAIGKHQTVTLSRPADAANLELDLQVAYQQAMLAQQQAMLAQMAAIRRAAEDPPAPTPWTTWTPLPKTSAICVTRQVARGVSYVSCQ
jgi:hypothetical protein